MAKIDKILGSVSPKQAVHKHERNMHKGKPMTKLAKGGKIDGCATKGHTKGRMR